MPFSPPDDGQPDLDILDDTDTVRSFIVHPPSGFVFDEFIEDTDGDVPTQTIYFKRADA